MNTFFENTIYLIIIISMIILIIDSPFNDPNGSFSKGIKDVEWLISIIFFIEAVLRIGALGFFSSCLPGKKGYI